MKFIIETDDLNKAKAVLAYLENTEGGKIVLQQAGKSDPKAETAASVSILPGTAAVAPNAAQAVPVPAATPVPATLAPVTAPPAATTAPVSAEDKAALDQGWTFDHVKAAATAFVSKLGNEGPAALQAILTEFGAKGAKDLSPAQFPLIHARLTAATAA